MLFVPSTRDDIKRYYQGTFVKFKETGDLLLYIQNVCSEYVSGQTQDGTDFKLYLSDEHPYEVDFPLPHKSFFQYGPDAVQLCRVPAKQYCRGISETNTSLLYSDGKQPHLINYPLGFDTLKAYVTKATPLTLGQAVGSAASGFRSCVLSKRMMYHRVTKKLYVDFIPIADVDSKLKVVGMLQSIFTPEVHHLLSSTKEAWKIK